VRVRVERAAGSESTPAELRVVISDTGQGIDPLFLPHLFDRFSQADGSAARKHGGLGLGLSIARQLVELHGGRISAWSAGLGQGASFTVALPIARPAEASRPAVDEPDRAIRLPITPLPESLTEVRLDGMSVLVVDDQPDALELARRLLAEAGARVSTAGSAPEALQQLQADLPDLLLSDIGMPEMDGYALIREIRERLEITSERLPAVAFTAFSRLEDQSRAIAAGYQAHLAKPLQPHRLLELVGHYARPRSATSGNAG
jgi:CheY-like chemotaxis protein